MYFFIILQLESVQSGFDSKRPLEQPSLHASDKDEVALSPGDNGGKVELGPDTPTTQKKTLSQEDMTVNKVIAYSIFISFPVLNKVEYVNH